MPKLNGNDNVKCVYGYNVDKENEAVIYNDETHTYIDKNDGSKYISATTLIHRYTQPFNADFWASYKALESLVDPLDFKYVKPRLLASKRWNNAYLEELEVDEELFNAKKEEILQSYEDKKKVACERGTAIHADMENLFYQKDPKVIKKYAGGGLFDVKKGYYKLDIDRGIYPEFLISHKFDDYLKVSGQIDLLIVDGHDITIIDYKTNNKIDMDSYFDKTTKKKQTMKYPLVNIPDCNFYHYTLQLSLYAYLLQQINPKYKIKKLAIVHFDHDGNENEYPCEYLKEDVAKMLMHYRKQNKVQMELTVDKPIEF